MSESLIYPMNLLPIVAEHHGLADDQFEEQAERLLLNYGYQTARAYLSDLECFRDWCEMQTPRILPLCPTAWQIGAYLRGLVEYGYSVNTVARRLSALRMFFDERPDHRAPNPARLVRVEREIASKPTSHGVAGASVVRIIDHQKQARSSDES